MTDETNLSTEETKITTDVKKIKDPKKVERGKYLASISKQAKEDKMRRKIEEELKVNGNDETWNFNSGHAVGLFGVGVAAAAIYGSYKFTNNKTTKNRKPDLETIKESEEPKTEPEPEPKPRNKSRLYRL